MEAEDGACPLPTHSPGRRAPNSHDRLESAVVYNGSAGCAVATVRPNLPFRLDDADAATARRFFFRISHSPPTGALAERELSELEGNRDYIGALKKIEQLQEAVLDELSESIRATLVQFLPKVTGVNVRIPFNDARALDRGWAFLN